MAKHKSPKIKYKAIDISTKIEIAKNLLADRGIPYKHPGHLVSKRLSGFLAELLVVVRGNGLYSRYDVLVNPKVEDKSNE